MALKRKGPKGPAEDERPKREVPDMFELAQRANNRASPKLVAQMLLLGVGAVAVIGSIVLAPTVLSAMSSMGSASASGSKQDMAGIGLVSFEMQRPDGVNTLSKVDLRINQRCLPKKWIVTSEAMSVLRLGWPESETPPRAGMSLNHASRFLSCSMAAERQRFCNRFYRERMAHRLKDFLKLSVKRRMHYNAVMMNPTARQMKKMFDAVQERIDSFGKDGNRRRKRINTGPPPILPKDLETAVANLSRQGYLKPDDFGSWGSTVPAPLRDAVFETGMAPACR